MVHHLDRALAPTPCLRSSVHPAVRLRELIPSGRRCTCQKWRWTSTKWGPKAVQVAVAAAGSRMEIDELVYSPTRQPRRGYMYTTLGLTRQWPTRHYP